MFKTFKINNLLFAFAILMLAASCNNNVQTSSGKSYLEKNKTSLMAGNSKDFKNALITAASVEPDIKLPARIGIAKIEGGTVVNISGEEMEAWQKVSSNISGENIGEFIPVNPLISKMVVKEVGGNYDVIETIRLGAARQHLDLVLIYESYDKTSSSANILSVANITIIGAYILPSNAVTAEGFASAILIDVLSAYPYGTAKATVTEKEISTRSGKNDVRRETSSKAKTEAVKKLTYEVEEMAKNLKANLGKNR